jgi:stringent starvation protein B
MKNFVINSIVEWTKYNSNFEVYFHCVVSEEMNIPKNIKEKFGVGKGISFKLNYNNTNPTFDFNNNTISWNTTFQGVPWVIEIHVKDIAAVQHNGFVMQFSRESMDESKKPDLKLVPNNKEYKKSPPTGDLKLVPE